MNCCQWGMATPLMQKYHDQEWGVPVHEDRKWFEFLLLEGAQAGLSWSTILKKRTGYQKAFDNFNPEKIARYSKGQVAALLANPGIIRNRLKVQAAITNARAFLDIQTHFGSFDAYIWRFVDGTPIQNHWKTENELPTQTIHSDALSTDLKRRGFKFVGTTICYALMQATGMVNDHITNCFRHDTIKALSAKGA